MLKKGFDAEKYIEEQSKFILERINRGKDVYKRQAISFSSSTIKIFSFIHLPFSNIEHIVRRAYFHVFYP